MATKSSKYTEQDIVVLEGLEPVRKRPGMYIGGVDSRGYHHLLWEIVDNAVDEAINGYASTIKVTLHKTLQAATVEDNGRGFPTGIMPKYGKSALEIILTTLHAGGKFGSGGYAFSGGLHGVGASVVNALSSELWVRVRRDDKEYEQGYARGAATTELTTVGKARGTGTKLYFRPDAEIFGEKAHFDAELVRERLEAKSYLHKGLRIVFTDEENGTTQEFSHQGGIADYLQKLVTDRGKPAQNPIVYFAREPEAEAGTRFELAFCWTEATDEFIRSFANGIPTSSGGSHENGLKAGMVKGVRNYIDTHGLLPKGLALSAEDIREGLCVILSCYVREPQFQGQTKERLNNPELTGELDGAIRTFVESWLNNNNKTYGEAIVGRIIQAARAREAAKAASLAVPRKSVVGHRLNLPGKLADCSSSDPSQSELFIVEGDSAGGSAKQGRNRRTQAILPLRGKVLNAEQASTTKLLSNKELQDIVSALGCGMGDSFDVSKLRYRRIFLLMDADSDGHHISTLLLTFFYRYLPKLIEGGHVFLAQPPLYRIDVGKETRWVLDDSEKDAMLAALPKNAKPEIQRFKGLGEMMPQQLWATTLDPKRRVALKIMVENKEETDRVLNELLGKDPSARFRFIMERATDAQNLDV